MRRRQEGFIDPLSLISLGFLVVTLVVSTIVVNKQKQLLNSKASYLCNMCMQDCNERTKNNPDPFDCGAACDSSCSAGGSETGGPAKTSTVPLPENTCTAGYINTTGVCCANGQMERILRASNCTTSTDCTGPTCTAPAPPPAQPETPSQPSEPTSALEPAKTCTVVKLNTAGTCPDGVTIKYVWRNADCSQTTDTCSAEQNKPTCNVGAIVNTAGTCPDGKTIRYVRLNADCVNTTTDTCPDSPATQTNQTTTTPPVDFCDWGNEIDCSARGLRCVPDAHGGYCESIKTPTCTPQLIASLSCQNGKRQQQWKESNCMVATRNVDDPTCSQTISKSDYQKCLDSDSTPAECQGIAANIGKTITTPAGQQECTPGTQLCSGGNLKICSNSGTWGLTTCANGCENNACKSAPAPAKKVDSNAGLIATYNILNAVTFGTFGNYVQTYQDINAQNPQASYLERALNPEGIAASAQLGVVLTAEAAAVAAAGPAAQAIAAAPGALAIANLVDDTATAIACARGNQNACDYILPAIANPIPGMSLASQYADDLTALSRSAANYFDEAASIMRLPDANTPAGWTLGTYGGQTVQLPGTTFADDALLSVVNRQYVSGGGTQRVIIDPINDPYLTQYLDEAQRFIDSQRTSRRVSRVPLAQQFVTQTFPGYSGVDIPRSVIEETMATQQSIYRQGGGTAYLGEFINCQAGVCREQSLILHSVLADSGKPSKVVTGYLGSGGKHAWVEFVDSVTGQRMVADSVWDFVLPVEEAYQIYGGVSNVTSQVFVVP